IEAAIRLAQSAPGIAVTPEQFDTDPLAFNCLNGTLDLHTGELRPHRREDLVTKLAPVTYDAQAECPLFEKFLRCIFHPRPDLITYIQRITGYCLTGKTHEQQLFFFYGPGG